MLRINPSSENTIATNVAAQVQGRWGKYEVNWQSVNDAYASSQNIFSAVAKAAVEVFLNLGKTFLNVAIELSNRVHTIFYPSAKIPAAAPGVIPTAQSAEDSDAIVYEEVEIAEVQNDDIEAEEEALPELDVLEEELPELKVVSNNWKKPVLAAGALTATAAAYVALRQCGLSGPIDHLPASAWNGIKNAGITVVAATQDAGQFVWSHTGEPVIDLASNVTFWPPSY